MNGFAIYYESEAYGVGRKVAGGIMGRQAAGSAFLRAVAKAGCEKLYCYTRTRELAVECAREVRDAGGTEVSVRWIDFLNPRRLDEAQLLYRPDPGIVSDAWRRLSHSTPRSYSICGITHTTATTNVMTVVAGLLTAPVEDWDAVICTSNAVRDSLRGLIEQQADYLRERVGATRLTLPQLPVIPLGVHCADYASRAAGREAARDGLKLEPADVVFLFVGRLSFVEKAHPFAMYLGLEACAKALPETRITLIQAGWFASPEVEAAFKTEAAMLCPSVRVIFVDGRDPAARDQAWAAADVFTSLSDNIQETFGLTPIEAMAAGLPVVVSDWDGYKDTVRHGLDGYRVPTLSLPPGGGGSLADGMEMALLTYRAYCGTVAQFTAVDVAGTAAAYIDLARDRALREKLGAAGQAHARRNFDWQVVFDRYLDLFADLGERRRSGAALHVPLKRRPRPDRPDPFTMFSKYPTAVIGPAIQFRLAADMTFETAITRRGVKSIGFAGPMLPAPQAIQAVFDLLAGGQWHSLKALAARANPKLPPIEPGLVWLSKAGVVEFRLPEPAGPGPA